MRRSLVPVSTVALAIIAVFAVPVHAQRVLGVGDDALVLPRGVLRVRTIGQWTSFNERYGMDTPGRTNGALEPLGIDFTLDTIGVREFPNLANLQAGLRSLTGNPNFGLTLGNTRVNLNDRAAAIPFVVEAGLSQRFSIRVQIPYVKTTSSVFFGVNTNQREGNLGFNPALANTIAAGVNTTMYNQFTAAAAQLSASLAACQGSSAPQCAPLNAQRGNAQALIASSSAFAGGVDQIYSGGSAGITFASPFVPITGTDAQLAIEARVAAFRALYASFGVNSITSTGPFAAQNRLTLTDAQTILSDPAFGVAADPLQTTTRGHIGDIDVGGTFLVFDSFGNSSEARMSPGGLNFRASAGGVVRLPTGQSDSPNNFVDIGTGNGQTDLEGRLYADLLVGSHFWQSFVVRYNDQLADNQFMRIIDLPNKELAPLYRRQKVRRDLGNAFEFETSPRIVLNDFFAVSGQYLYRHKGQDHYTGTFAVDSAVTGFADITLDASTLDLETETTEHRLGGGISFSNLFAFQEGKAKIPFEVTYLHWQTVKGAGGNQPKFFTDQIQLRLYARLFGGK